MYIDPFFERLQKRPKLELPAQETKPKKDSIAKGHKQLDNQVQKELLPNAHLLQKRKPKTILVVRYNGDAIRKTEVKVLGNLWPT